MMEPQSYDDLVFVPRSAVRFPLELPLPPEFRADDLATWPKWPGRLEFVGGRLLYMSPCGQRQQRVAASLVSVAEAWSTQHPDLVVGGNEAGMRLGGDVRGADMAIWLRKPGPTPGGFAREPPLLAAEVAGLDEGEEGLREKARWYFEHGVEVVWLVFPESREVLVLEPRREQRYAGSQRIAPHPLLPGLEPEVSRFFRQLDP